jgi:hypothetical protein
MSLDNSFPEIAEANHPDLCPFLGVAADSQTSLSYPSAVNFCHRSRPYGTPKLDFQQSFCFSDAHSTCPVFIRNGRAPLPANMLFVADRPLQQNKAILLWLVGGIVVLLGLMGVLWGIQNRHIHGGSLFGFLGNSSSTPDTLPLTTGTAAFVNMPALEISNTATLQTPSLTPTLQPTGSPTQTPSPTFTPTSTRKFQFIPTPTPTNTFYFRKKTPVPTTAAPPTTTAPTAPPT